MLPAKNINFFRTRAYTGMPWIPTTFGDRLIQQVCDKLVDLNADAVVIIYYLPRSVGGPAEAAEK